MCFCVQGFGEGRWCQASPPFYIPTFRTVHYNPTSTKHFSFSVGSVPRALQPQLGILRYFASYMEQHLMKGGDLPSVEEVEVPAPPLLLQWVKTDQALLMLFSDGTVQVRAHPGFAGKVWCPRVLGRSVDLVVSKP